MAGDGQWGLGALRQHGPQLGGGMHVELKQRVLLQPHLALRRQ